ncbi:MAG: IS110 family transposase [Candidatus Colwellbacteria bacterium]|nr:IS110 family transposase [Candidatus Colwellbacteria bacterium]
MASFNYHLGIDLHKQFAYWTLINNAREVLFQGKVDTEKNATLKALNNLPVPAQETQAAVEPVEQWGWYSEILEQKGYTIFLTDSLKAKLIAGSRLKNDKVDSLALAELLRSDFLPKAFLAPRKDRELREFLRWRVFYVRVSTRVKNRIHGILAKHGLRAPKTDLFGKKGMDWLKQQELRPVFKRELDSLLKAYEVIKDEVRILTNEAKRMVSKDEELKILQSIPGIGPLGALTIKSEVGDFSRFARPEKLASYAGLVSSSYSSGGKLRFGKITKQGSRYLRWIMVEATQRPSPKLGKLYSFYQKIKTKKGNKIARVALARKLLCLCWVLANKKEHFSVLPCRGSGSVTQ